ncbi:GNAT family N-acetyltransferase [Fictibacillus nanhaiensis]|uniref:GNAT family N-acetyltransferase n=1 Tax=Fictibacillus nanhaiensis TaxID=742169 RepID=UPI003C18488F
MEIHYAKKHDLYKIIELDKKMIGSEHRKGEINQAINEDRCLILYQEDVIAGFLIYHTYFFDCCFISLIMVDPAYQRKGVASSLLTHMSKISPTNKLFSSTNESNESMKKSFLKNHFKKSGFVENIDEGDPEIIYFKMCY